MVLKIQSCVTCTNNGTSQWYYWSNGRRMYGTVDFFSRFVRVMFSYGYWTPPFGDYMGVDNDYIIINYFFRAGYRLYSYTQHGGYYSAIYRFYTGVSREYLLLVLHWIPLKFNNFNNWFRYIGCYLYKPLHMLHFFIIIVIYLFEGSI